MNLTRKELASVKAGSNINPQSLISMVDEITSLRIDRDRIGIQRLAIEIANVLFRSDGENADRLILELPNGRDGSGWCKEAVVDQIIAKLNDELV